MNVYIKYTDELYHHGIKGQRWGIRRYQNPDGSLTAEGQKRYGISDTTIKKGTKIGSVSTYMSSKMYQENGRPMYAYALKDKRDRKVYKGPFSQYLYSRGALIVAEHKYKVIKDLKMPSKQQRVDEFKNLYNDKKFKKDLLNTLRPIQNKMIEYEDSMHYSSPQIKNAVKKLNLLKLKTDIDYAAAYEIFNHAMESAHSFKSTTEYMNRMSNKYDAMIDDNNQGIYNNAHNPVIIFRTDQVLKRIGNVKIVSTRKAGRDTRKIRKDQGGTVTF